MKMLKTMKKPEGFLNAIKKQVKNMKNYMVILPLSAMTLCVALPQGANAQVAIAEVIKAGVKRVIKAVDLRVQRLQNRTIWLQNAQKTLENQLSKLKLGEIADWTERQRDLYERYYRELWEVKSAITYIKRVRELVESQSLLVEEYQWAWGLFTKDRHFSLDELENMKRIYTGILEESIKNVDEILIVVNSFGTQMSDVSRLEIINKATDRINGNLNDLKRFNRQNIGVSLQRANSLDEVSRLKKIYGIEQ